MAKQFPTRTLNNGVEMPTLGFGTMNIGDRQATVRAIHAAFDAGYRLLDTAAMYRNEEAVGEAVRTGSLPRDAIFVTTKLNNDAHGYEPAKRALAASLEALGLDYVDLYLIHWPNPLPTRGAWRELNAEIWRAFEEALDAGQIRALGISNFRRHHFDALLETATVMPAVHQIKFMPGIRQPDVEAFSREHDVVLEAYTPLGKGQALLNDPAVVAIATRLERTPAQVCLRYALENDYVPLPKSGDEGRIRENADIFDFSLNADDHAVLDALTPHSHLPVDPDTADF